MNADPETLLAGLVFALYLADCVRLLGADEALLLSRGGRRWRAAFGARQWRIAGREPLLLNPLLPDQAAFRLRWRFVPPVPQAPQAKPRAGRAGPGPAAAPKLVELPAPAARLGIFAWIVAATVLGVLPFSLLMRLGPAVTLPAAAAIYASVLASLAAVWIWRAPLQLKPSAIGLLAFECLACPPHAVNIVRKVVALRPVDEDFEAAAARLLQAPQQEEARAQCLARLDEQIERDGDDAPASRPLLEARRRFVAQPIDPAVDRPSGGSAAK